MTSSLTRFSLMTIVRSFLLIFLLATGVRGWCADLYFDISDRNDTDVDSVQVVASGESWVVSLNDLARAAHWTYTLSGERATVVAEDLTVVLRAGNAFAQSGARFLQMRQTPLAQHRVFWVPLGELERLFDGKLVVHEEASDILVMSLTAAPVPTMDAVAPNWTLKTVIVDPGHGGRDPGAIGRGGVQEKTIVLDLARRLAAALRDSGLHVELTRDRDEFISLQQRTRLANAGRGDLFLSIHCNSHRDPSIHGIETYFLSPPRTARAVDAAQKENSVVDLEEDTSGYHELAEASFILQAMATSQNLKDSETWAASVASQIATATELESRGVDQAGFYVLMGASMPALLVECGYLSHAGDAAFLSSENGRQKLVKALAASILSMKLKLETSSSR